MCIIITAQRIQAAKEKFHSYCFEPSPTSFNRVRNQIKGNKDLYEDKEIMKYLYVYNVPVGNKSGVSLEFLMTSGSTCDHAGEFDMRNMKPGKMLDNDPTRKKAEIELVPAIKLLNKFKPESINDDGQKGDVHQINEVFAMKIDIQGFEPNVLAG